MHISPFTSAPRPFHLLCCGQTNQSCLETLKVDMLGTHQRQLFKRRTLYQLENMLPEMFWFGIA